MKYRERWRKVRDYEDLYVVSSCGRVRSLDRIMFNGGIWKGRIMSQSNDKDGYKQLKLCKEGIRKDFKVHRLVAKAFIPNPNNLPQVNHIDEVKSNNHADNLEWCTNEYNSNYGTRNKRISKAHLGKKKRCLD